MSIFSQTGIGDKNVFESRRLVLLSGSGEGQAPHELLLASVNHHPTGSKKDTEYVRDGIFVDFTNPIFAGYMISHKLKEEDRNNFLKICSADARSKTVCSFMAKFFNWYFKGYRFKCDACTFI